MIRIGTPHTATETKLLLLGAGELGKEVAVEAQRLGVTVIAVDRYANAPAMQLGLPVPGIRQLGPSASYVILGEGYSAGLAYEIDEQALSAPDTALRLLGKPEIKGQRRLGVALARAESVTEAREKAKKVAQSVRVIL